MRKPTFGQIQLKEKWKILPCEGTYPKIQPLVIESNLNLSGMWTLSNVLSHLTVKSIYQCTTRELLFGAITNQLYSSQHPVKATRLRSVKVFFFFHPLGLLVVLVILPLLLPDCHTERLPNSLSLCTENLTPPRKPVIGTAIQLVGKLPKIQSMGSAHWNSW